MIFWHGINDANDIILLLIGCGALACLLVIVWSFAMVFLTQRPKPLKKGIYSVRVRDIETCGNCNKLTTYQIESERGGSDV